MRSYYVNIAGIDHTVKLEEKTAKRLKARPVEDPSTKAKAAAEETEKAEAEKKAAEQAKSAKPQNKAKAPENK